MKIDWKGTGRNFVAPFFNKNDELEERGKSNENSFSKGKRTYRYSIASIAMLIIINLLALVAGLHLSRIRAKGGIGGTEGLFLWVLIVFLSIFFLILFATSIRLLFPAKKTFYGRKSLRIVMATSTILLIDILLLVRRWIEVNS